MTAPEHEPGVTLMTPEEVRDLLHLRSIRSVYKLAYRHNWSFKVTLSRRAIRFERQGFLRWVRGRKGSSL
jgi:hypothetical protein